MPADDLSAVILSAICRLIVAPDGATMELVPDERGRLELLLARSSATGCQRTATTSATHSRSDRCESRSHQQIMPGRTSLPGSPIASSTSRTATGSGWTRPTAPCGHRATLDLGPPPD